MLPGSRAIIAISQTESSAQARAGHQISRSLPDAFRSSMLAGETAPPAERSSGEMLSECTRGNSTVTMTPRAVVYPDTSKQTRQIDHPDEQMLRLPFQAMPPVETGHQQRTSPL